MLCVMCLFDVMCWVWFCRFCVLWLLTLALILFFDVGCWASISLVGWVKFELWTGFVQAREKSKHLEMVLMDGRRDTVHAIFKKDDMESWEVGLKEGKAYYMYNFRVVPNHGLYKLYFTGGTTLRQVDLAEIPLQSYEFMSFEYITHGNYDPIMLIDVIGVVEEVKFQLPNGNPTRLVLNLKDLSGQIVGCTLWSDQATKSMFWLKENPNLSVRGLTISNSLYGSKLLINYEVPNFVIYRERLSSVCLGEPSNVSQSLSIGQYSQDSDFSELDRFLYKSKVLSISNIRDAAGLQVDHEDVAYTCSCGKFNEKSIMRYRVEIMVYHGKGSTTFFFWDHD
ncbi:hypothetical protein GmHk_04G010163 [Glycine max]|nr:hypothetical protein GmHk_04G010163 [Glycine max]